MAIVRKHIYFSGQVQGVGFRYRAKNAARANDLTGWVDNLWDGRVEMEVQGELSGIERMIQEIEMGILLLVFFCVIGILRSNFLLHKKRSASK